MDNGSKYAAGDCDDKCMRGLDFSQILRMDLPSSLSELVSWDACLLFAG